MTTGTVIFDLDGTLIDAVKLHGKTFVQAFKEFGFDISFSEVLNLVGITGMEIASRLADPKIAKKIYDRKTELFFEHFDNFDEIKGATTTLNELKERGNKLAIATSGNNRVMTRVLERFNWSFDLIITAEDVAKGKPEPESLNKIKSTLPGPYVFVGDTHFDKEAGDAAGIRTLLLGKDLQNLSELLDMKLF